ncbi:MAG: ABC transporter permease [bacterium]
MFKNYLKTALRNLKRNVVYSFINVVGLAIGMACCIVIMLFVMDELSWDRFHKNADRIFRITATTDVQGREVSYATTNPELSTYIVEEIPEVANAVRIVAHSGFTMSQEGKNFTINPIYADPSLFEIFTFPLIRGDVHTVLNDPNGAVISEGLAERLFGADDPMGQIISIYSLTDKYDLHITGIMKDVPKNSHFWFEFVIPLKYLEKKYEDTESSIVLCHTYILLNDKNKYRTVEEKIPAIVVNHFGNRYASRIKSCSLQPITSIHLNSDMALELGRNSNISYSYTYSGIAAVILFIACINFMNLSTARSSRRSKEVGMRKVVGAGKRQLIFQFIGESIILAFIALVIAIIIAYFLLPFFNKLVFRNLKLDFLRNSSLYIGLLILTVFVGLLSGSYPAFFLSAYQPLHVIKGEKMTDSLFSRIIRKGLVIVQFAASLVFIIATIVVFRQLRFITKQDFGFDAENVIEIPIKIFSDFSQKGDIIVTEFSKHPNILDVIVTYSPAPGGYAGYPLKCIPEGFDEDNPVMMKGNRVGPDFFKFFKINVIQGRAFSKEIQSDVESAVMINETAARVLGWDSPIGKTIKSDGFFNDSPVIGVVKDYHQGSLYNRIEPIVYSFVSDYLKDILIRIRPENKQETIKFIEETWKKMPTHIPLSYSFMDESIKKGAYYKDRQSGKIFTFSAVLAIILACLGLFGLTSFTVEQRIKEIGIRKVFGASVSGILYLLSMDFAKLVLFANIIAWPIAYYIMNKWLQNFAYKIGLNIWIFLSAGMLVLLISLITMSSQSFKAATSNPVDTLRYE